MHHPTHMILHTTTFVRPVVEHLLEQEITQWVHHEGSIHRPSHYERTPLPRSYISFLITWKTISQNHASPLSYLISLIVMLKDGWFAPAKLSKSPIKTITSAYTSCDQLRPVSRFSAYIQINPSAIHPLKSCHL